MRWVTRKRIHLNRTATAWLIRRFLDRAGEILFVAPDEIARVQTDQPREMEERLLDRARVEIGVERIRGLVESRCMTGIVESGLCTWDLISSERSSISTAVPKTSYGCGWP
ncbi:MAG: chromate resistance protein ChrB domain-containing protein [Acidobacteriota bacterium]